MGAVVCLGEMKNVLNILIMTYEGKRPHTDLTSVSLLVLCAAYVVDVLKSL